MTVPGFEPGIPATKKSTMAGITKFITQQYFPSFLIVLYVFIVIFSFLVLFIDFFSHAIFVYSCVTKQTLTQTYVSL